ncbi:MAG: glucose-fructose oxidoreductase [Candidatus Poribacteria bacterium]|nr:MAG: glucose-fructose oxidoreductase [Candidatus Poribacteria bacterium]
MAYRVGIIGFAHMHVTWLVDQFSALEAVEWVACADTVPSRPSLSEAPMTRRANLKYSVEKAGIPKVYQDYREMLEKESFDIIIACPENARHGEVTEAAAAAGAHVITEKPPAASFDELLRMIRATREAGVELIVNWPSTWSPAWRLAKRLVDNGLIGRVFQFKWRAGSRGPLADLSSQEKAAEWWHHAEDGGGALLDYCCYGANLSRWVLGEPAQAVLGLRGNFASHFADADDNAALLVRYPSAMAILEATWSCVNHGVSALAVIYGTEGTIALERRGGVRLFQDGGEGELHEPEPLPEGRRNVAEEFIHHLETGEPVHETLRPEINLDAMAILDAGIRSARSGHLEPVRSWIW